MAKLLLLTDSNFVKNFSAFPGKKIKNIDVKVCQNKQVLLSEIGNINEGIMVITTWDNLATEAATNKKDSADRSIEMCFNHILFSVMTAVECSNGKLAAGFIAPIYWRSHSELVRKGINHAYSLLRDSPVKDIWMAGHIQGLQVGGDGVHLVPKAANKYIELIQNMFALIDKSKKFGLVVFNDAPEQESSATHEGEDDEVEMGLPLQPPDKEVSPARTTSMVSVSMLSMDPVVGISSGVHRFNPSTGSNLDPLGPSRQSGASRSLFSVPPPPIHPQGVPSLTGGESRKQGEAADWDQTRQEVRFLLAKSLNDNLVMAAVKEEQDTEANKAMLNRVSVLGLDLPAFQSLSPPDKIILMKSKVQALADQLADEDQKFEVIFVRDQFRLIKGTRQVVVEAKFATDKQACDLRMNFVKKMKSNTNNSINITPVFRQATRVRIEILYAAASLMKRFDSAIVKTTCVQYVPKPVLKIVRRDQGGNVFTKTMTFIEVVKWVKDNDQYNQINLARAYERAGASFRGIMAQTFVVLN